MLNNDIDVITLFIFILGIATVFLSITVGFKFRKYCSYIEKEGCEKSLTNAISFQLFGEAVIGFGTLIFATAAHFQWLPNWSVETQSGLRFVMFAATSATTYHLFKTLLRMEDGFAKKASRESDVN